MCSKIKTHTADERGGKYRTGWGIFLKKKITATIFAQKRSASIADDAVEALLF
jgi:hypothetical protein